MRRARASTWWKMLLLGSLYLAQGLPFGFYVQALPVILREQGLGLPAIGLTSLLALPWGLKFLWAPVVDAHGSKRWGMRRSWLLPLQALSVGLMLWMSTLDPAHELPLILAGFFLANLLAATQDIATDGLAVEVLEPAERGLGNGLQVAAYRVGMVLGGGMLLVIFERLQWSGAFIALTGMLAMVSLPILIGGEPARGKHTEGLEIEEGRLQFGELWRFFGRDGMRRWLLLLLLYKGGDAMASGMLRPFLKDLGYGLEDVGWMLGTVGFVAGLFGALAGGVGLRWVGRRRSLLLFGLLQALAVGAYVLPASVELDWWSLAAICGLEHFAGGMATAALFTLMMDACRPEHAGKDYTIQASIVVLATGLATALSGFSAQALGYAWHFGLSACLSAAALVLVLGPLTIAEEVEPGTSP